MSTGNINAVKRLHEEATVFLGCAYMSFELTREGLTYTLERSKGGIDITSMKAGGVDALFISFGAEGIALASYGPKAEDLFKQPTRRLYDLVFKGADVIKRVLWDIDAMWRNAEALGNKVEIALSASDVLRINRQGKIAIFMHLTGGLIDRDLAVLRTYHRLGLRGIHIACGDCVDWADSCEGLAVCGGLSDFGREVVSEMNRLGMVIDLSHASDQTVKDVLDVSTQPVVVSHSSCRALVPLMRNVPDDLLEALARNGGVIGMHFHPLFLDRAYMNALIATDYYDDYDCRASAALSAKYKNPFELAAAMYKSDEWEMARIAAGLAPRVSSIASVPPVPLDCLVDHIDHVVRVAGIDCVGLGTDYGGVPFPLEGLENVSKLPMLTAALLERGYSEEDVKKILGGNFLRVLKTVTG